MTHAEIRENASVRTWELANGNIIFFLCILNFLYFSGYAGFFLYIKLTTAREEWPG